MLEGAKRRASMCQAFYLIFSIRERYIVPVSSNFPVPKGHDKFRMEPVRNCGKICQRVTFCFVPLFLWFQMLIR